MATPLSFKNDEQADERLNPANDLRAREQAGYDREFDDITKNYDKSADPTQENDNIAAAREQENTPNTSGWRQNFTGQGSNGKGITFSSLKGTLRKKGPLGFIISIMLGGGLLGGGLLTPGIALIHIKEVVENKIDTMSSVVDTRMQMVISSRIKAQGVSGKCSGMIKIKCRFNTFSEEQLASMKEQGIKVVDGNGNEIEADTKPTGEAKMILADGEEVKASQFTSKIKTDPAFRSTLRDVYPTRFNVWNDKIAGLFEKAKGLTRDPKVVDSDEGGDPKKNQEEFNKNLQENATLGQDPTTGIDPQEYGGAIDSEKSQLNSAVSQGQNVSLDSSPSGVLEAPKVSTGLMNTIKDQALGVLNPASMAVGACMAYKYEKTLVYAAKIPGIIQEMRDAFFILSVADSIKAGNATPNSVSMVMNMFEKPDKYGKSFGDATGYTYPEYGTVSNVPVQAGISGSAILAFMSTNLAFLNNHIGKTTLTLGCNAITNPLGQAITTVAGIVLGLISGGSSAAADEAVDGTVQETIKLLVQHLTEKISEKIGDKEAVMATAKAAGKELGKQAAGFAGFMLAGQLISRYFTPYIAHLATGTLFNADMNGVAAMDTVTAGAGAANDGVAQSRGLTALSPAQAMAFMNFNNKSTSTYVADMQASANPFDINNPYSLGNNLGFTISSFFGNLNILKNPASLLSAPATIFSSILHPLASTQAFADSTANQQALMAECQDSDANQNGTIATDPFCNPIYGVQDMNALQNTTPDQVVDYMTSSGQIDDNGDPIPGSAFDQYSQACFGDNVGPISSLTNNDMLSECYDQQKFAAVYDNPSSSEGGYIASTSPVAGAGNTSEFTMFHLYQIDKGIIDQMDDPYSPDTSTTSTTTTTPTTGSGNLPDAGKSAPEIAKDIIPYMNQGKLTCSGGSCQDITDTANGTHLSCDAASLQPKLLQVILGLLQHNQTIAASVICTGHGGAPSDPHQMGAAIDLTAVNGVSYGGNTSPGAWTSNGDTNNSKWQEFYKTLTSFASPSDFVLNQGQCYGTGQIPSLKGYHVWSNIPGYGYDLCHHQHLGVDQTDINTAPVVQ